MPVVAVIAAVSGVAATVGAAAATAIGLGTVGAVAATAIGSGIIAGGITAIQGGDVSDVLESAVKGGVTSFVGGTVAGAVGNAVAEATGSTIAGAAAGGAAGTLATGGDAEDILRSGLLAGTGAGIGEYQQELRQEQFDTGMTESGLAGQTSVEELPQIPIEAAPIEAPSIIELINQLTTPEAPEEAQEIVITAPREQTVPTQEEMQPSIDELLSVLAPYEVTQELPLEQIQNEVMAEPDIQPLPVDNSGLIAALDVAKGVAPFVINTVLPVQSATQEPEQTGYPILPIPGDWRSPTYNQEFTPSAPIDFGSPALLAGTQWENQPQFQSPQAYSLSDLINTLNYQSVPFTQQQYQMPGQVMSIDDVISQYRTAPTVGTTDVIGNLDGKPVSIADIISGIQSQYG